MGVLHTYEKFNTNAAEAIVPFVTDIFRPKSVVDVGCGIGTWLNTYQKYGAEKILGLDGDHVPRQDMLIDEEYFRPIDLNSIHKLNIGRFDLVNCLEVAEHLPEESAQMFVETLASLSDVIVFSAAIPGQFGQNHFNEQYPDYWQELFSRYGFVYLDAFRKRYWNNKKVDWWYRQNMFLVVKEDIAQTLQLEKWDGSVWIAPDIYNFYIQTLDTKNKERLDMPTKIILREPTVAQFLKQQLKRLIGS